MAHRCLLCGSSATQQAKDLFDTRFGIDATYSVAGCLSCGLGYTLPRPSAGVLKKLYEKYYNFGGEKNTAYTKFRAFFHSSFIYRLWLALDGDISFHGEKGSGRLLDVGCNEGRGLSLYSENGFTAEGLELNEKAAQAARDRGYAVHTELLEKFRPESPYDVVVLSNVLEHAVNPFEMLTHVSRILKKGAEVWISVPNYASWQKKVFGKYWINWHVPFHLTHFSPSTLGRVLERSGFEVVKVTHLSPALWTAQSLISALSSRRGKPTRALRNPLLVAGLLAFIRGALFPALWLGNSLGRGDCMTVKARKIQLPRHK